MIGVYRIDNCSVHEHAAETPRYSAERATNEFQIKVIAHTAPERSCSALKMVSSGVLWSVDVCVCALLILHGCICGQRQQMSAGIQRLYGQQCDKLLYMSRQPCARTHSDQDRPAMLRMRALDVVVAARVYIYCASQHEG